ncbi:hypothetical protein [Photobacterium carnosum]|uniref:hypothetical protein n=1 Tax=Photobacterium carnosum TaxID=2023717 RepID=UPI001E56FB2A|nr:hypothetical protein [Photobacterium carnosum]
MNKHQQSGMTTLLITSMLLIVALLFSLASYKNLFYQIKRTQNEVLARQAHWAAEGGLECGYSKIKQEMNLSNITKPSYFIESCDNTNLTVSLDKIDTGKYELLAESKININHAVKNIKKIIVAGSNRSSGAIKATSNLIFDSSGGNSDVYPEPGEKNGSMYECVLLRYAGEVKIIGRLINVGLHYIYPPYDGFYSGDDALYPKCSINHQSTVENDIITATDKPPVFGDDYVKDTIFDPFYDTFSVKRSDWKEGVRDKSTVISGSTDCATTIIRSINVDSDRIWVEGDCDLGDDISLIQDKITAVGIAGIVLVIQDGILLVNGVGDLNALIYHFKTPDSSFVPTEGKWNLLLGGVPSNNGLTSIEKNHVAYFQNGSFRIKGGYVLDTPGLSAKFNGSLDFNFNSDVFKDALDDLKAVKWQQGSWHDF